jgi:hypothetical protein
MIRALVTIGTKRIYDNVHRTIQETSLVSSLPCPCGQAYAGNCDRMDRQRS